MLNSPNSKLWQHMWNVYQKNLLETQCPGFHWRLVTLVLSAFLLFTSSVVSDSLWIRGLQHTRLLCPSLSPKVCSNSCPLNQCAIQPSHPLLPPSPPSLNLSQHEESFPMSWHFPSGGQSIGASASVLSMIIQGWFPLGLTGLISLLPKGLSRVFSSTIIQRPFQYCKTLHSTLLGPLIMFILSYQINFINYS